MIGLEVKAIPPLLFVGTWILSELPSGVRVVIDLAALAILFAGFMVLGKIRAASDASERAARAWKEERDAEIAKAERLAEELAAALGRETELRIEVSRLEARPTLETLEQEIVKLQRIITASGGVAPQMETTS